MIERDKCTILKNLWMVCSLCISRNPKGKNLLKRFFPPKGRRLISAHTISYRPRDKPWNFASLVAKILGDKSFAWPSIVFFFHIFCRRYDAKIYDIISSRERQAKWFALRTLQRNENQRLLRIQFFAKQEK